MPKAQMTHEVAILNFFETAPLDKAEMLFNIVKDKMRARCASNGPAVVRRKEARSSRSQETPLPQAVEKQ
jgi:hypothetical protein